MHERNQWVTGTSNNPELRQAQCERCRVNQGVPFVVSLSNHFFRGALPLLLLFLLAAGSAQASSDKQANREREALRRVQLQLQQAQGQLSTLEQEKAVLSQDLDKTTREAKAAQSRAQRLNRDLKAERRKRESLEQELEQTKKDLVSTRDRLAQAENQLAETRNTLARTSQTLATTENDKRRLESIKAHQEREIASCESKNLKLYQTGRDLMTRFEQKSCNEILAQKEPLFGLKRVEIENLMEEYRDKLDEQKLIKAPGN